jgi:ribosomal protein S18 acetylase RimI-like enzyme
MPLPRRTAPSWFEFKISIYNSDAFLSGGNLMSGIIGLRKKLSAQGYFLIRLLFNAAGRLGFRVSLFHMYCYQKNGSGSSSTEVTDPIDLRSEPVLSRPDDTMLSVWRGDGKIAAVSMTRVPLYVPYINADVVTDGTYLYDIWVDKNQRTKGIARRLTDEAIRISPDLKLYALIDFSNLPSRRLVEGYGFTLADQVIYINILGHAFRNESSRKYLQAS